MENSQSAGLVDAIVTSDSTLPENGIRVDMTERDMLIEAHDTRTIVLRLSESPVRFEDVKKWVRANWLAGGISSIHEIGNGLHLVTFDHPQAASQILAQGPWRRNSASDDGTYALLAKWRRGLDPLSFRFSSRPIWIELPGLPVEFQGPANLQSVAKVFGEPRIIQSPLTSSDNSLLYPRICVLWDEVKKLPESVTFFGPQAEVLLKQKVVFRCLPGACSNCQIRGRGCWNVNNCTTSLSWMSQVPSSSPLKVITVPKISHSGV